MLTRRGICLGSMLLSDFLRRGRGEMMGLLVRVYGDGDGWLTY